MDPVVDGRDTGCRRRHRERRKAFPGNPDCRIWSPGIYDHDDFLDVAKRLVLSKRYAKIRVIVTDPGRAMRNGNRFVGVARRLNTYIDLRNAHEDYRGHREALLIADDHALLYRIDAARWEGIADSYDPVVTRRYLALFDTIWNLSEPGPEFREVRV